MSENTNVVHGWIPLIGGEKAPPKGRKFEVLHFGYHPPRFRFISDAMMYFPRLVPMDKDGSYVKRANATHWREKL